MGRRKRRTNRLLKKSPAGTKTKKQNAAEGTIVRKSATIWNADAADDVSGNAGEVAELPNCHSPAAVNSDGFAETHAKIGETAEKSLKCDHVSGVIGDNSDAQINSSSTEIVPSSIEHSSNFILGYDTEDAGPPVLQCIKNSPHPLSQGESSKQMDGDCCVSKDRPSSFENIPESNTVLCPIQRHCTVPEGKEQYSVPFLLGDMSHMGSAVSAATGEALTSKDYFHYYSNEKDLEDSKNGKASLPLEISENISAEIKTGELMQEIENKCELVRMSDNSPHDLSNDSENSSCCSFDAILKIQAINPVPTEIDLDELENLIRRDWKITTDAENIMYPPPVNIHKKDIGGKKLVSDGNQNTDTPKTIGSVKIPRVRIFPDTLSNNAAYAQRSNLSGTLKDDLFIDDERREIIVSADNSATMDSRFPREWSRAQTEEIEAHGHSEDKPNYKTSETSFSAGIPQSSHYSNKNINIPAFNFLDLPDEPGCLTPGTNELLGILSKTSVNLQIPSLSKENIDSSKGVKRKSPPSG